MDNLLTIIRKIVNPDITKDKLEQLVKLPIDQLYSELCKLSTYTKATTRYRAVARHREVHSLLGSIRLSRGAYLDIGGGDGIITHAIGKRRGYSDIYSLDLETPFDYRERKQTRGVKYLLINPVKPIIKLPDNSCSLVTAIMSLHHITPSAFDKEMREIYRVLQTGGYFIIREHDCRGVDDKDLIDMEHLLYEHSVKVSPTSCKEKYKHGYQAYYKSKEEWISILKQYNFIPINNPVFKQKNNPTRYYYQLFQKV